MEEGCLSEFLSGFLSLQDFQLEANQSLSPKKNRHSRQEHKKAVIGYLTGPWKIKIS